MFRVLTQLVPCLLVCVLIGSAFISIQGMPQDAPAAQGAKQEVTVIPTINFQADRLWADGATPVLIWISLEAVKGSQN